MGDLLQSCRAKKGNDQTLINSPPRSHSCSIIRRLDAPFTMSSCSKDNAAPALTKKQRGRLKKLRKRVLEVKQGSETSGITSPSDWLEWQELHAATANDDKAIAVGPSVRLRKGKQSQEWKRAEGSDIRDVLWNMASHLSAPSHKRKREEAFTPRIPPWCTLHNPCAAQSVAVVELCLNDECTWDEIQKHLFVLSKLLAGQYKSKVALPILTQWFQGNQPKSITEVLLYASPSKASKAKTSSSQSKVADGGEPNEDLLKNVVGSLQELALPLKERKKEGFPIVVGDAERKMVDRSSNGLTNAISSESLLTDLKEAKQIVQKCSVTIKDGAEGEEVFVATAKTGHAESPRVFAVDCEMVKTEKGAELARITLLQLTGVGQSADGDVSYSVVMEEFVKPHDPVLDYVTEYSGVTAAILNKVTTRLEQIQVAIMANIDEKDLLIGHSLENDLRALRLVHDNVVDTAMVFRAKKGRRKYCKCATASVLSTHNMCHSSLASCLSSSASVVYSARENHPVQSRRRRSLQRRGRSCCSQSGCTSCTRRLVVPNQGTW